MHDWNDKLWWCKYGEELEREFVDNIAPSYGLNAIINPEKETDVYAPDLVVNGEIADLKVQVTPFFTSDNPQWCVTFNFKSRKLYTLYYPDIVIYFFVHWRTLKWRNVIVEPLYGVWRVRLRDMDFSTLHEYKNGKKSYLMDLRDFERL